MKSLKLPVPLLPSKFPLPSSYIFAGYMYYLLFGLFYLLSLLPLPVLYLFSEMIWRLLYYIIGYRKKVVFKNLLIAFPSSTHKQRVRIAKDFYRHFSDNFLEVIKFMTAGEAYFRKHYTGDFSIYQQLLAKGKKCHTHLGHIFNWELANLAMPLVTPYQLLTVYAPISSKPMERLFHYIRTRTGSVLIPANKMSRSMVAYRDQLYNLALVADQSPRIPYNNYWIPFFGRTTAFLKGPEKSARSVDAAVVFANFTKVKRGYYTAHFSLATDNPRSLAEGELTKRYAAFLEKVIGEQPAMWLWSHNRWKHEYQPAYELPYHLSA